MRKEFEMRRHLLDRVLNETEADLHTPHAHDDPAFTAAANAARVGLVEFARYEGEAIDEKPKACPTTLKSHVLISKPKSYALYDLIQRNRSRGETPVVRARYWKRRVA